MGKMDWHRNKRASIGRAAAREEYSRSGTVPFGPVTGERHAKALAEAQKWEEAYAEAEKLSKRRRF